MSEQSLVERLRSRSGEYVADHHPTSYEDLVTGNLLIEAASRIATLEAALGEAREFIAGDADIVDIPGGAASRLLARLDAALSASPSGMVMVPAEAFKTFCDEALTLARICDYREREPFMIAKAALDRLSPAQAKEGG